MDPIQIIGILISFFSLTLGASDLLLRMATKDNKVKQVSWKMTLLVFPAMFFVVVPRILTISLIMAYAKSYNFIFLTAYLALSLGINYPYVRRQEQISYRTATEHKRYCFIELLNNKLHGLTPPGGLVSPPGGFASLLCDQGLRFASIILCQAFWM